MKKLSIYIFMIILMFGFPAGILAQQATELESVKVNLWPEYDRPSMLVIYHIALSPQVDLPFEMDLKIPSSAGSPHAVAVRQPDNSLISIPYTQNPEGEWINIAFQASAPEIQLEFYDPNLVKEDINRSYTYQWPGDYDVKDFAIEVQQPEGASGISIRPGMASTNQGGDGLTYYLINVGPLSRGQLFEISMTYEKSSDSLTFNDMPVSPIEPIEEPENGFISLTSVLPWILGFLGIVLIVGGGIWYWRSGNQRTQSQRSGRSRRRVKSDLLKADDDSGIVYCHSCGKRASPGDRFCRACGTALRIQ